MRQFIHKAGIGRFAYMMVYLSVMLLFCAGSSWGEITSGMSLTLYADEQNHPELHYRLGVDHIALTMVIKNETSWQINTDRGFSQVDLHRALIITDPNGNKHAITDEGEETFDVLPAISLNQISMTKAEVLPGDWVRSVVIVNLRTLFLTMNTTPGLYIIEARQPFVRFAWTIQAAPVGLLGPQKEPNNWDGTVDSNKLQILIEPAQGAQLQIQVLDNSAQPAKPIAQVPVRVFKKADIASGNPQETWDKTARVLEGTTSPEGLTVWDSEEDVQCLSEDEYVAMALYAGDYKESTIVQGPAEGWLSGCNGSVTKEIYFGEPAVSGRFSVFALNSVWLRDDAIIYSGDVAARVASPGPWLDANAEISIAAGVNAEDGVGIYGDTVNISATASVDNVYYNELVNNGIVRGQQVTPLSLPVWDPPQFLAGTPGTEDIIVSPGGNRDLNPGAYDDVLVLFGGSLNLTGGIYHFDSFKVTAWATLTYSAPVEIRVKKRFELDRDNLVGPASTGDHSARDIVIYVEGTDAGILNEAVEIDKNSIVKANIYAPNGTIRIESDCDIEGSLIAKDVKIGRRTTVRLNSAFAEPPATPGDFDGDGDIDGADLAALIAAWVSGSLAADLNGDGVVNAADIDYFAGIYGSN